MPDMLLQQGSDALANLMQSVNQLYFVVFGCICLFGVVGCAMMESGISRSKNSLAGVSKNLAALAISVALFWLVGYAFSDFWDGNGFLGYHHFVGHDIMSRESGEMFFFCCVAGLVAAFVSRGLVERMSIIAHIIMAILLTGFCFPVVAHWIWSVEGWLYVGTQVDSGRATFMDDAGCCAIHLMVATIIFIGCLFLGERYKKGQNSSLIIASLGGLMAIIAIVGLHMGLRRSIAGSDRHGHAEGFELGIAALNTLAAGTAGSGICLLLGRFYKKKWDVLTGINGFMAGQISVAAGVYHFYPGIAFIVGLLGGLSYILWVQFSKFFIDDPLKAFAVHFGGGLWGIFAAPLMIRFDSLFYNFTYFHFQVIGWNALGAFVVIIWSLFLFGILFLLLRFCRILRISKEAERDGLDLYYHDKKAISVRERTYSYKDGERETRSRDKKSKSKDRKVKVKKDKKIKVKEEVHYNVAAGVKIDDNIYITKERKSSSDSSSSSKSAKIKAGGGITINIEGGHKTDSSSSSSSSHNAKANIVFGSDQEIKVNLNMKKDSSSDSDSKKNIKIGFGVGGGIKVDGSGSGSDSSSSKKSASGGIKIGFGVGGGVKVDASGSGSDSSSSKKSASGGIKIGFSGGVKAHGSGSDSDSSSSKKSASGGIKIGFGVGGGVKVHGSGSESDSSSSSKKSASGGIKIGFSGGVKAHGSGSDSDSSSSKKSASGGIKIGFSGGVKAHGSGSDSDSSSSKKSGSGGGGIKIGFSGGVKAHGSGSDSDSSSSKKSGSGGGGIKIGFSGGVKAHGSGSDSDSSSSSSKSKKSGSGGIRIGFG